MAYTVLRISDGQHGFPFLYDGKYLYCPDYNPTVYGKDPQYCLSMHYGSPTGEPISIIFDHTEFLACKPFRYEGHNYHQSLYIGWPKTHGSQYVCLQVWKDATNVGGEDYILDGGEADANYVSVQEALVDNNPPFSISVIVNKYGIIIPGNRTELESYFRENYGYADSKVTIWPEVAIIDEDDMYWRNTTTSPIGEYDFRFKTTGLPFNINDQWTDALRIVGIMQVEIEHTQKDENGNPLRMYITFRSNPFQLTEEIFAQLLCIGDKEQQLDFNDMNINKPRIINRSVNRVVQMTAQTDSKANIIQPVFFRTRELANIIIHPEVTENICINLDAYKAQADRFFIKIEGITFPEIGRTESGVIFKVQGNLLPGKVAGGVYYILNQDTNLVTTGKYIYEA